MGPIAVLCARADSVYKSLPACDVYDAERDALSIGMVVVYARVAAAPVRLDTLSRNS